MALGTAGTVVTAAVVAGLAGAGAALVIGGARSPVPASSPAEVRRVAELEERISKQDNELRSLRTRIEELSAARSGDGAPAGSPGRQGPAGIEGSDLPSTEPGDAEGLHPDEVADLPPEHRERLEKLFAGLRAKEQEDARKARRQAQEVRMRGRLDRLPAELGLTPEVKDSVVRAYMDRGDRQRAIFEEARAAGTADSLRAAQEKVQALREESRQALLLILTPEQLKAVEQVADRGMPAAAGRVAGRDGANRARGGARDGAGPSGTAPR